MKDEQGIVEIGPRTPKTFMTEAQVFGEFDRVLSPRYETLARFLEGKILLLVNDMERSTPTPKMIDLVGRYLEAKGKDFGKMDVDVIIASGTHKTPTDDVVRKILGHHYERFGGRVRLHSAKEGKFEDIGKSKLGTPVKFDSQILGYDRILTVNSVEPHYFAGYTGGRKSLMPGVCHWDTIEYNHKYAMHRESKVLSLESNPLSRDMEEVAGMIISRLERDGCHLLALNIVNLGSELYALKVGEMGSVMRPLVEKANEVFTVEVKGKFDVVIAETSYPMNRNLYQSLKSFENAKVALREGGVLILEARCNEGLGPEEFYRVMTSAKEPKEIVEKVRKAYTLGAHKTTNVLAFLEWGKMYIVSELGNEVVRNCFCKPFKTVEEALGAAAMELGMKNPRVLRVREANNVIPLVR